MTRVAIVGAGQAGASAATKLRALGFDGAISMFGDEPDLPYERPPLSKAYLLGKVERERLYLRTASFYAEHAIEVMTGTRVDAIDRAGKRLVAGAQSFAYDHLVLTTGSRPILLPEAIGGRLGGVHVVRTLTDVDAIAKECRTGARALVVGGGYIGLEAAAVFSGLGMAVTLVEREARILQRVAATETSDYFRALHRGHGVDIREKTGLVRLTGNGRVERAELSTGDTLDVDVVIVGIGIRPDVALAEAAGLAVDGGIVVDALGRTSDPAIWAAGDCTVFPYRGRRIRLESVQNAIDQAHTVAENIISASKTAAGKNYVPMPWFWSDQFDVKLQIAGLNHGHDRVVVRHGARAGAVSHWYYAGDELLAVDAMNEPRSFMGGRRLIENGISPPADVVADSRRDLKDLIQA